MKGAIEFYVKLGAGVNCVDSFWHVSVLDLSTECPPVAHIISSSTRLAPIDGRIHHQLTHHHVIIPYSQKML